MSSNQPGRFLYRKGVPIWRDIVVLQWAAQVISAILVIGFIYFLISNVLQAAEARGLGLGFRFLSLEAGFPVGDTL
jgi:ABC-type amino acid transport system permease subunit